MAAANFRRRQDELDERNAVALLAYALAVSAAAITLLLNAWGVL